MITNLENEERVAKEKIRDAELDLIDKIKKDPIKWNSSNLKFKITESESASNLSVGVQLLNTADEIKHAGPINPNMNSWNIIQRINCYGNFELNFEFKIDRQANQNSLLIIGNWFGLQFNRKIESSKYVLFMKQANGLHEYYQDTLDMPVRFGVWEKELSTNFIGHIMSSIKIDN